MDGWKVRSTAVAVVCLLAGACGDDTPSASSSSTTSVDASGPSTTAAPSTPLTTPVDHELYGEEVVAALPIDIELEGGGDVGIEFLGYGDGSVWVGLHRSHAVARVDPVSGEIVATIAIDPTPGSTDAAEPEVSGPGTGTGSLTASDDAVWVLDLGGFSWKIDPSTNEITARVDQPGLRGEAGVLVHEGDIWTLVGSGAQRIDGTSNTIEATIDLGISFQPNGNQLAGSPGAVWTTANGGFVRIDTATNTPGEPLPVSGHPLGSTGGLVWTITGDGVVAADAATGAQVGSITRPAGIGPLMIDSSTMAGETIWALGNPPDGELGADQWWQLVRFDLATSTSSNVDFLNAEFDFIVGMVEAEDSLWATDFARNHLLRVETFSLAPP